jgi:hypothetical protein
MDSRKVLREKSRENTRRIDQNLDGKVQIEDEKMGGGGGEVQESQASLKKPK